METQNLNEASMQRFYQHLTKDNDCIAIVSAERHFGFYDPQYEREINNKNTAALRKMVSTHKHFLGISKDYGFHKARGGYTYQGLDGESGTFEEHSTCIYAHCEDEVTEHKFREFVKFLGELYRQENVLFVGRDKKVYWIYTYGPKKGKMEQKGDWHPHAIEEFNEESKTREFFYTSIKGRESGFEKEPKKSKVKVELKSMQCESEAVTDWKWIGAKPTEIAHMRDMFFKLNEAIESGVESYSSLFKHCYSFGLDESLMPPYRETLKENLKAAIKQRLLE